MSRYGKGSAGAPGLQEGAHSAHGALGQHQGLAAAMAAREGEGLVALPYASASCWRARHRRSWKKKTTVLMAGSINAITPPVSSSPLST